MLLILISAAPPPQPPNNLRINSSSGNSVRLTITFDPSFSADNRVERYSIWSQNVTECPNDTSISAGVGGVPGYYTCDGLEAGVEYNFTVRAVNCGNQESIETDVITIAPRSKLAQFSILSMEVFFSADCQI